MLEHKIQLFELIFYVFHWYFSRIFGIISNKFKWCIKLNESTCISAIWSYKVLIWFKIVEKWNSYYRDTFPLKCAIYIWQQNEEMFQPQISWNLMSIRSIFHCNFTASHIDCQTHIRIVIYEHGTPLDEPQSFELYLCQRKSSSVKLQLLLKCSHFRLRKS